MVKIARPAGANESFKKAFAPLSIEHITLSLAELFLWFLYMLNNNFRPDDYVNTPQTFYTFWKDTLEEKKWW